MVKCPNLIKNGWTSMEDFIVDVISKVDAFPLCSDAELEQCFLKLCQAGIKERSFMSIMLQLFLHIKLHLQN